ncbi:MAG TPA: FAD:protein FMN transferase [Solirubrobacteraceae bacterium]|nr:FAD:protein FMN transferase [Solirubrobacteraceae bacterium]
MSAAEAIERFDCFGGSCGVIVAGDLPRRDAAEAARGAREQLLEWHERFSRFLPGSELSRLNADPRERVPAGPLLVYLAALARHAAELTGGLVDATLLGELESSGYAGGLPPALPLGLALGLAAERRPAGPAPAPRWRSLHVDHRAGTVTRPPGVALDSGGLAKGLFADLVAESLCEHESFAVDCGGDLALGGAAGLLRPVEVQSPFDRSVLHVFELDRGGVATSGIGRRAWLGADGRPAHHLLDPASGRAAYTGVVQATALAPTAALAEIHAKAAVLSGPERGAAWLRWGGVLVLDDGSHRLIEARAGTPESNTGADLAVAA